MFSIAQIQRIDIFLLLQIFFIFDRINVQKTTLHKGDLTMEHELELLEFETFTLTMDDDTEQEFAIMDEFAVEGKSYYVVSEVNGYEVSADTFVFGYHMEGDELYIDNIDDDDEYEKIAAAYDALCEAEEE
jgi:hypothetical protein